MTLANPLPDAPGSLVVRDRWQTGVYRTPVPIVEMDARGWKRYRLKEWHFVSFTTDQWYVALGLVQLGYVANLFSYAIDLVQEKLVGESGILSPFGRALHVAESSIHGTTSWRSRGASASIEARNGWDLTLDIPLGKKRLRGRAHIDTRESLAMVHRLGPRRIAYTHKAAGWPASGRLELSGQSIRLDGGLAASDWTRSQASRVTQWRWASVSGLLRDGRSFGVNLSAQVYEDARGHSVENAFWLEGEVRRLSGVRFEVPEEPRTERWSIRSLDSDEVDIEFDPLGAREEHMNLGLIRTAFVQPYGRFRGRVCGNDITGTFGVVEDHLSVW